MRALRLLLFGDTHLGFDLPQRPRVEKRRRGEDFFANTDRALRLGRELGVDAIVHGGDVFFRSRVPTPVVDRAYEMFRAAAADGPPLYLVPGNHERSRLPPSLFLHHPRLHVFDRPRTFLLEAGGQRVALAGFPFVRAARRDVPTLQRELRARAPPADRHLLCFHQAVEGAAVEGFVFRDREDTVRARDLAGWDAVLSGHIHRRQVLWPAPGRLPPVCYAGSVERTSFAERDEPKGVFLIDLPPDGPLAPANFRFRELVTRPMRERTVRLGGGVHAEAAKRAIAVALAREAANAVVRLRVEPLGAHALLSAAAIRAAAGPDQSVELVRPASTDPTNVEHNQAPERTSGEV